MTLVSIAAGFSFTTALIFMVLYGRYRWWVTPAGWSLMTMALSLAGLSAASLMLDVLDDPRSHQVAVVALLLAGLNTTYRIVVMIHVNKEE